MKNVFDGYIKSGASLVLALCSLQRLEAATILVPEIAGDFEFELSSRDREILSISTKGPALRPSVPKVPKPPRVSPPVTRVPAGRTRNTGRTPVPSSTGGSSSRVKPVKQPTPDPVVVPPPPVIESPPPVVDPIEPTELSNRLSFSVSSQYADKFYFRGLDVLDRVSPDDAPNGITSNGIGLNYDDGFGGIWQAKFNYFEALDTQLPNGAARQQQPNLLPDRNASTNENFRMPSRERYSEADFNLDYSRDIIGSLSGSLGAGYYRFSDARWWGDRDTLEFSAGLAYQTKWASFFTTYTHDVGAFDGGLLEAGANGTAISVWSRPNSPMALSVIPNARVSYDFAYNGDNNGWNNAQIGLDFPLRLTSNLTLSLGANYSMDLGDANRDGSNRTDDGFWFTATLSAGDILWARKSAAAAGPAGAVAGGKSPLGGKDPVYGKIPVMQKAQLSGWRLSGGGSTRSLGTALGSSAGISPLIRAESLFHKRTNTGSGKLADGSSAVVYANGRVNGASTGGDTQGAATFSGGTASGSVSNRDQQILFNSTLYSYRSEFDSYGTDAGDEDSRISPYFRLDKEFWPKDNISASFGIVYSYTSQEMDSGTDLLSLDRFYETAAVNYFLYNGSNQLGGELPELVIVNDADYNKNAFVVADANINKPYNRSPQRGVQSIETEQTRVATFVRTGLDVSLHTISLPIGFSMDVGERLHVSLEAGPTLNLFNYDLSTEAYAQQLDNTAGGRELENKLNFRGNRGIFGSTDFVEGDTSGSSPGSSNLPGTGAAGGAQAQNSNPVIPTILPRKPQGAQGGTPGAPSGGKGANVSSPVLPGRTVAHRAWANSGNEFRFGASAQASVQYDLNAADTWYVDVWGRYDYVSPFSISNGANSAEIDASAWSIGAGLGYRF